MGPERERERIVISASGLDRGPGPASTSLGARRLRPRQRLTAVGWFLLLWCGLPVVFSKTLVAHVLTSFSFRFDSTNMPSRWWLNRFLSMIINAWSDVFLWAILDPDYGWIGCGFLVMSLATLVFIGLAHLFEAMGVLVYDEKVD